MEDFGHVTIRQLVKRFADLHYEAERLKTRYAELEQQATAIRSLVSEDLLNAGVRELLDESTNQTKALEAPTMTLRERIMECLKEVDSPLRPTEIVERLCSPLWDNKQSLSAKVNTELRRMLRRDDAEIEKLPKARYRLKGKG